MWWCCGKTDPNAKGCLKSKHVVDNNRQNDGEAPKEKTAAQLKLHKCICCKKFGHFADECPSDPNIRKHLAHHMDEETERVDELYQGGIKKVHLEVMKDTNLKMM